jgi:multidrug resistance protein
VTSVAPDRVRAGPLLATVCLALFVDTLLYSVVVPVLPDYTRRLGAADWAVGLLFAAYAIGLLLASPVAGAISDRIGRRKPLIIGSFGVALATVVFAYADSYGVLFGARLLQGVSAAAVWTAGIALIADVLPRDRHGSAMGMAMAATSMGLIVGPPLGGLLTQQFGHGAPFLVTAAVAVVNGLVQLILVPATGTRQPRPSHLRRLLGHPPAFATIAAVAVGAGALSFLEPTLPLDLADRLGQGVGAIGLAFGAATLVHSGTSVGTGYVTYRLPYGVFAGAGLVVMGAILPILVVAGSLLGVIVVLCLFAAGLTFVLVPALPELGRLVDRLDAGYGGAYAMFNAAYAVGMLVGPVAGGAGLGVATARVVYAAAGTAVAIVGFLLLAGEAASYARSKPHLAPRSALVARQPKRSSDAHREADVPRRRSHTAS